MAASLEIRRLAPRDVADVTAAFGAIGWSKPASLCYRYRTLRRGESVRVGDDLVLWLTRELDG